MDPFRAERLRRSHSQRFRAPPARVFPLLCPVREKEWIEGWDCEMVYSASGVAEKDCVFRTPSPDGPGNEVWVVTRHEPTFRIEFVRVDAFRVMSLSIALEDGGDGTTKAVNEQVLTSLTPEGGHRLDQLSDAFAVELRIGEAMLNHYLTTGERLPPREAAALLGAEPDLAASPHASRPSCGGPGAPFRAARKAMAYAHVLRAPRERVFPLLCPVREYEWFEPWRCEVLYSESGVAEHGCVFRTDFPERGGPEVWVTCVYEPPGHIGFVRVNDRRVIRYDVTLTPRGPEETVIEWTQVLTALNEAGNEELRVLGEARYNREMRALNGMLEHFLATGTMLRLSRPG